MPNRFHNIGKAYEAAFGEPLSALFTQLEKDDEVQTSDRRDPPVAVAADPGRSGLEPVATTGRAVI